MRRQGLLSTRKKPPYIHLEEDCKTNIVFCTTMDSITMKEVKFTTTYTDAYQSHITKEINTST